MIHEAIVHYCFASNNLFVNKHVLLRCLFFKEKLVFTKSFPDFFSNDVGTLFDGHVSVPMIFKDICQHCGSNMFRIIFNLLRKVPLMQKHYSIMAFCTSPS